VEYVLLALLVLAIPASGVAGFVIAMKLRARVTGLEQRLAVAEAALARAGLAPDRGATLVVPETSVELPEPAFVPPIEVSAAEEPVVVAPEPAMPEPAVPAGPGFEERLGTRWAVWVGGVALALGGIALVRYSVEQGLLGPAARVGAGILFALGLLAGGEFLRRRDARGETLAPTGWPAIAQTPAIVTAAGACTAFAVAYAAHALYGFLGPAPAFVLLGLIGVVTMVASALHGPGLAGLGLLGALAVPLLVGGGDPALWPLVLYLVPVVATAYGVARLRLWRWLALGAAAGALAWGLLLIVATGADPAPVLAHVLVQMGLAGFFLVAAPHRGTADADARPDALAGGVLLGFAALAVLATIDTNLGATRPLFAAAVAAILLLLAARFPAAASAAVSAGLVTAGVLFFWPVAREALSEPTAVLPGALAPVPMPEAVSAYFAFAALVSLAIAAVGFWRLARSADLPLSAGAFYAAAAALTPCAALVITYLRITDYLRVTDVGRTLPFAAVAGLTAAAFAWIATRLRARDSDAPAARLGLGAAASAAVATLALGLVFWLDRGMLTVALALAALGTAWVADRAAIPALRWAVGGLGFVVLGRLVYDPAIVPEPGGAILVNWILWGYGIPALAFHLAGRILERGGRDRIVRLAESLSILFAGFLVLFEIRHALHAGDPLAASSNHLEAGLVAAAALGFSFVMVRIDARRPDVVTRIASLAFGAVSLAISAFGLCLFANPLFAREAVLGGPILNSLLPAYLLPAVAAAALAVAARATRPRWYVLAAAILAIRRVFQGPVIDLDLPTSHGELWAYSVALLVIGIGLLGLGLWRQVRLARIASALYIVGAVVKVFLVDLATLEGAMRAFSLIGLGLALVGIGLTYQRLLGRREQAA
jgi:uncharacterized membrane protein